jgi:hypothetical protein
MKHRNMGFAWVLPWFNVYFSGDHNLKMRSTSLEKCPAGRPHDPSNFEGQKSWITLIWGIGVSKNWKNM